MRVNLLRQGVIQLRQPVRSAVKYTGNYKVVDADEFIKSFVVYISLLRLIRSLYVLFSSNSGT